jgi:hypothetical protein
MKEELKFEHDSRQEENTEFDRIRGEYDTRDGDDSDNKCSAVRWQ